MTSRWNATSDLDYYDRDRRSGIERTCNGCGEPVMVDRDEVYRVQVFCPSCVERMREPRDQPAETKGAA